MSQTPTFYYDLSSPYAYLAAQRVDEVLGAQPHWQPFVFGALLRAQQRLPWSLQPEVREPGQRAVEERAAARRLPPVRWPPGWPDQSYSVRPLRAVTWAREHGGAELVKALTLALFRVEFVEGRALDELDALLDAAGSCGIDPEELGAGIEEQAIKDALREATDEAIARGVPGIPTVAVGDQLFWGDDRLEEAAAALTQ